MEKQTVRPLKCILLGEAGVGKTSIRGCLIHNKFCNPRATIGPDFETKQIDFIHTIDNETKTYNEIVQLWDTCGQERFAALGVAYYRKCNAVVIVYDITNRKSFEFVEIWIEELFIQSNARHINQQLSIAIVGNKIDKNEQRKVTFQELQDLCNKYRRIDKYYTMEQILSESKSRSLHRGFIRASQIEISKLVPMDICKLCFEFYFDFAESNSIIHGYEVSAKDAIGINDMFENVVKVCKTAEYYHPNKTKWSLEPPSLDFSHNEIKSNNMFCIAL